MGADAHLFADKIELAPGRPACDIDIAAEAQRIDRRIDYILERGDRGQVNDRDYLAGDVGEAVAVGVQDFRRPMQLFGKRGGEEVFDSRAALIGAQIAPRGFALTVLDALHVARLVSRRAQRGEPLVLHQHQEMLLRQIGRR